MASQRTARPRSQRGWTLLECLLAVAIMAMVFVATVPLLHSETAALDTARPMILKVQEARFVLAHVATALRQARAVTQVADGGGPAASMTFLARDGTLTTFQRDAASDEVQYGPAGSEAILAKNCTGLAITCLAADKQVLPSAPTSLAKTAGVHVAITVVDPEGKKGPTTIQTLVALERTRPTVVINEIMYNPLAAWGDKNQNRWVEFHNPTSDAIDLSGWRIWTRDDSAPDTILPNAYHGTGSTVIPSGGYAVITSMDTQLYHEVLKNGDFESVNMGDWQFPSWDWAREWGDAASGNYKICLQGTGWTTMYQDFKIRADAEGDVQVTVRERYSPGFGRPGVRIRITNPGGTPLLTVYDGDCSADWTSHSADVTAFKGASVRLEISGYRANATKAWVRIDAATINWGPISRNCVRLRVGDSRIGDHIEDKQVFLGEANRLRDAVVFEKAWGGDDDGSSLSRTSPFDPATEQESWEPGPYRGTPGEPNS